jgi:hypothetical protein
LSYMLTNTKIQIPRCTACLSYRLPNTNIQIPPYCSPPKAKIKVTP